MKGKLLKLSAVTLVAVLLSAFAFSAIAFAQGPTPTPPRVGLGLGPRGGFGSGGSLIAVTAKALNLSETDLLTALRAGKSIADVAKDKGVALDKIASAVIAAREETLKSAVAAGRVTQAQADTALATLKANITAHLSEKWTPRGYGMGAGFMDANKDGVCDNCGATGQPPRGPRWGR